MAENKLVVPNCCTCFTLRTGSLIIAILTLLFSIAEAGYGIYLGVNGVPEGWFDVAIDVINIVFAIVLIHGIRTENRNMVIAWVWGTAIVVALTVILGVLFIVLTGSFVAAVIIFILAALQVYFIVVVRSYAISLETPPLAA